MSVVVWPSGVRLHQLTGITLQRQQGWIRTEMETGPPKYRRRFSAVIEYREIPVEWPGDEYQAFATWFKDILLEGGNAFTWSDPATGLDVTMRFRSPPEFQQIIPGPVNQQWWQGTLDLEILP